MDKNESTDDKNDNIESTEALLNGGSEDIDAWVRDVSTTKMMHPMVWW